MLAKLIDEIHCLYIVAFLDTVGVKGAIINIAIGLKNAVGIDPGEADIAVVHVAKGASV